MGQIVEKPRGDLEKVLPRKDLKLRDVPKANPRVQPEDWLSEGIQITPRGNFSQISSKAFS